MNFLDTSSDVSSLCAEEERALSAFIRAMFAISTIASDPGSGARQVGALNAMRVPAVTLDEDGLVVDMNAAAQAIFDENIKIKDNGIFLRDPEARQGLKGAIDRLRVTPRLNPLTADPVIVPRKDKLPVILRVWPCSSETQVEAEGARFILTLNALDPRPVPPAPLLAKVFGFTASEARLACVMARGIPCSIAAQELNISRETVRNQLKSIFAKTDTHRQAALVALLLRVE